MEVRVASSREPVCFGQPCTDLYALVCCSQERAAASTVTRANSGESLPPGAIASQSWQPRPAKSQAWPQDLSTSEDMVRANGSNGANGGSNDARILLI